MTRPNIQIDDLVREMTDDEDAEWQAVAAANPPLEETPTE